MLQRRYAADRERHDLVRPKFLIHNRQIIFPINVTNSHWYICIYDVELNTLFIADSLGVHFSLTEKVKRVIALLLGTIEHETLVVNSIEVPTQKNGYDCGAFTIAYAALTARNYSLHGFRQNHATDFRKKILESILMGRLTF